MGNKGKRLKEEPSKNSNKKRSKKDNNIDELPKALRKESQDSNTKENMGKKKKKKMGKGKKILLILLALLLVAGGVFAYKTYQNGWGMSGMLATAMGHDANTKKNLPEFKTLILGISTDLESELTDTIIVASYNPNTQKATLLSIPRDTFTGKYKKRASASEKINALYTLKNGPEGTLAAVNELTGLDIENYVVVRTEALIELVDALGGVQFNVPIDMKYDDKTQDLHINLQAGEQEINGEQAEQLLRFRHNNDGSSYPVEYGDNDIGRMRTQREFIAAVMHQTLKAENIFKLGQFLDIAKENVITNVNFDSVKDYIPYLVEFNTENLVTDTLPGVSEKINNVWFYINDKEETEELVQKLFFSSEEQSNEQENTANSKETAIIEIQNGTGNTAVADEVEAKLTEAGFNVKRTTKANETSETVITNKKYVDNNILEEIKTTLGMGRIANNASSTSKVDISITLGKDYLK